MPEKGLLHVSCNTFIKYMQQNIDDTEILRFIFTKYFWKTLNYLTIKKDYNVINKEYILQIAQKWRKNV